MSSYSDIEKALATLIAIKETSRPPYFDRWNSTDFAYRDIDDIVSEAFCFGQNYGEWRAVQDTLEVQIMILQAGMDTILECEELSHADVWGDDDWAFSTATKHTALLFADAINKGQE